MCTEESRRQKATSKAWVGGGEGRGSTRVGKGLAVLTWPSTGPLGFGGFAGDPAMPQSSDPA